MLSRKKIEKVVKKCNHGFYYAILRVTNIQKGLYEEKERLLGEFLGI